MQKYSLWFNEFSHADMKNLHRGHGGHRLLVTRFAKGDAIMRKGEQATFMAILLQGELGVRLAAGRGFPRRLHKGALFGEAVTRRSHDGYARRAHDGYATGTRRLRAGYGMVMR